MGGLFFVFELLLVLESLDEGLLGEILCVRNVAHNPVNLHEDSPHVLRNKAILAFQQLHAGLDDLVHRDKDGGFHRFLI